MTRALVRTRGVGHGDGQSEEKRGNPAHDEIGLTGLANAHRSGSSLCGYICNCMGFLPESVLRPWPMQRGECAERSGGANAPLRLACGARRRDGPQNIVLGWQLNHSFHLAPAFSLSTALQFDKCECFQVRQLGGWFSPFPGTLG